MRTEDAWPRRLELPRVGRSACTIECIVCRLDSAATAGGIWGIRRKAEGDFAISIVGVGSCVFLHRDGWWPLSHLSEGSGLKSPSEIA
jgi:hypothetical protein